MPRSHVILPYEQLDDTLIITPAGDALTMQEAQLEWEVDHLHKVIEQPGVRHVVIDVGQSPYFGSLLIGSLIVLCRKAQLGGGQSLLCNASDGMRDALDIMKVDSIIQYCPTREEALATLSAAAADPE